MQENMPQVFLRYESYPSKIEFSTLFAATIRRPEVIFALNFCKYWFIGV